LFSCKKAQVPDAKIIFDQPKKIECYFFISPIRVNGSSTKTAPLNKATVLNAKGDLFIILMYLLTMILKYSLVVY
jgi:hypothetical protein